jgi:hypothetical protein
MTLFFFAELSAHYQIFSEIEPRSMKRSAETRRERALEACATFGWPPSVAAKAAARFPDVAGSCVAPFLRRIEAIGSIFSIGRADLSAVASAKEEALREGGQRAWLTIGSIFIGNRARWKRAPTL